MISTDGRLSDFVSGEDALGRHQGTPSLGRSAGHALEEDLGIAIVIWMIVAHEENPNLIYTKSGVDRSDDSAWSGVEVGVEWTVDEPNPARPASLCVGDEIVRPLFLGRLCPRGIPPLMTCGEPRRKNLPIVMSLFRGDVQNIRHFELAVSGLEFRATSVDGPYFNSQSTLWYQYLRFLTFVKVKMSSIGLGYALASSSAASLGTP